MTWNNKPVSAHEEGQVAMLCGIQLVTSVGHMACDP